MASSHNDVVSHRPGSRWLIAVGVVVLGALSACADTASAGRGTAARRRDGRRRRGRPGPTAQGKLRGYTTVRELTDQADLVVRGQVEAGGYRVDEVLYAGPGSAVKAGDRIVLGGLDGRTVDMVHMSKLEPGQVTVLYLSADPEAKTYATLSGDFGVFDLAGSADAAVATTRSQSMAVTGLLMANPDASGKGFRTAVGQLRALAREHA